MKKTNILAIGAAVLIFYSCKPTERNYEAAYSKATAAAQGRANNESDEETGGKLEAIDGPRMEKIGNDSIYVASQTVKVFEGEPTEENGNYGIAIAKYSMPTNARRHLQDVKKEYPDAFITYDGQKSYYVMIQRVSSIPEAADPIRIYEATHPQTPYLGLQGSPVVLFISPK